MNAVTVLGKDKGENIIEVHQRMTISWERSYILLLERTDGCSSNKVQYTQGHLLTHQSHTLTAKDIGEKRDDDLDRFTKLINDMRNIKMTMPRMQLNSKFVNNMLPEWSRFITEVKLNRGLKESNFDQLYAYLKQHEVHANENRIMMERFIQPNNDPLARTSVRNASVQQYPTQSSKSPQFRKRTISPQLTTFQLDSGSPFKTENLEFEKLRLMQGTKLWFKTGKLWFKISVEDTMRLIKEPTLSENTMPEEMV
ncbi:hypothetical protein Tco_0596367 [Tanacetum coccineum]